MTNLEKWNHYRFIIEDKTSDYYQSQVEDKNIPTYFYAVGLSGVVRRREITGFEYNHYRHGMLLSYKGKRPTRNDVTRIMEYAQSEIPFSVENLYFEYVEVWDVINNYTSRSVVKFLDLINQVNLWYTKEEAMKYAEDLARKLDEEKKFREIHSKDPSYNYSANGYKFLNWANDWKSRFYDEDGNLCSETGKSKVSSRYAKEDHPEYCNCREQQHQLIDVSHNRSGSENTVSCPVCMIYWKYDSSG